MRLTLHLQDEQSMVAVAVPFHRIVPPVLSSGAMSLEYIKSNPMLVSIYGKIVVLPNKSTSNNSSPQVNSMDLFRTENELEVSTNLNDFRRKRGIVLVQVRAEGLDLSSLYDIMQYQTNFFATGISIVPGVGNVYSMVFSKSNFKILDMTRFAVIECVIPQTTGRRASHRDDIMFRFM